MTKTRKQKGYVWRAGAWWWLRYADSVVENGAVVRKPNLARKLALVQPEHNRMKRPPESVVKLQADFMDRINKMRHTPELNVTLAQFVENTFFPHMEGRRTPSTISTHRCYWRSEIGPRCGKHPVREFFTAHAQRVLDSLARDRPELTRNTLFHVKSLLSAIMRLAVNQGFHSGPNPLREVEVPAGRKGRVTVAHSLSTELLMLRILPEPARTAIAVAAFSGLRRGEIQGLLWENYSGDELNVTRAIWNGHAGDPKTLSSKAPIPVLALLKRMLDEHRTRAGNPKSGPVFPSLTGTPICLNNLLRNQILPTLERCACGKRRREHAGEDHEYKRNPLLPAWCGWHAFRRGLATVLHDLDVDDKTTQAILRHSNVAVTQAAYIKTLPQQSIDAMKRLETRITEENEKRMVC
jgi:integrase